MPIQKASPAQSLAVRTGGLGPQRAASLRVWRPVKNVHNFRKQWMPRGRTTGNVQMHVATDKNVELVKERWWARDSAENMVDITSLRQLTDELDAAKDKLVVVDFYAHWCNSCRALYPKLCKLARANPDVVFLKINWMDNKALCKSLGIKALPYFHFYRGAEGRVEAFSASITKFQKLKDAVARHSTPRCSLGPSLNCRDLICSPDGKPLTPVDVARAKISKQFSDSPPSPRESFAGSAV